MNLFKEEQIIVGLVVYNTICQIWILKFNVNPKRGGIMIKEIIIKY